MIKEDEVLFAEIAAENKGIEEGKLAMLIKIAEIFSDEDQCFPVFTGHNLVNAMSSLGLHFGRGKGKRFILTNENIDNYRASKYEKLTIGDTVEIVYPDIGMIIDGKPTTIIKPYIKKV